MKQKNMAWEVSEMLIIAVLLALVIRFFVVQAYKIPSGSMLQTLQIGDYLLVTRFNYAVKIPFTQREILRTGEPDYGDIIVFQYPKDASLDYIKRVIGRPGDTIEIRDKQVFRNGKPIREGYTQFTRPHTRIPGVDSMEKITVPEDHFFVLGDNRDGSEDSRFWGFVPRENIRGKAWIIYWSWENWTTIRWNRIGTRLYPEASIGGV
ncbi:signal peptidase I [Deltaproteobacteria bacterium]|nr:signal peptidase I [Deltaproteobacteria bacterium]